MAPRGKQKTASAGSNGIVSEGINFSQQMDGISSGYGIIDMVSGVEGILFPKATIMELYGLKSSSKTTVVLETIAYNTLINPDFKTLYVDYEKMLRKEYPYLRSLGIDPNSPNFVCITPSTMQEGNGEVLKRVKTEHYDLIVVDTIAAMRPREELENGYGETKNMGLRGKLMSEFLRNLMADLPADGPAVVFINQMYKDISTPGYMQQYTTPASDALAFYAAIRFEVKEISKLKEKIINPYTFEEDEIPVGSIIQIKTAKNKVGIPFLVSRYMISYGYGIDIIPSMISAGIKSGTIYNKGSSKGAFLYKLDGVEQNSINGMNKLIKHFRSNSNLAIAVGSQMNELWAEEMKRFAERSVIKDPEFRTSRVEYETDDEDEELVSDGHVSLSDPTIAPSDEPSSLSLDSVLAEEPKHKIKLVEKEEKQPVEDLIKLDNPAKNSNLKLNLKL